MNVYLIRHGNTIEAETGKIQSPDSPLSDQGILEAQSAGKRLIRENIDLILSSKWPRSKNTAKIISSEINKPLKLIKGIHEKQTNPTLHNISLGDPIHKELEEELKANWNNLDWKFKGEGESLRDLTIRAANFRDLIIENFLGKNLAVISHSGFIRGVIISCILGNNFSDRDYLNLYVSLHISNTGISLLEFNEIKQSWKIIYLNDHLHLSSKLTK